MSRLQNYADVRTRFMEYRRRADAVFNLLGQGATVTNDVEVAGVIGITDGELRTVRHLLEKIGTLRWERLPNEGQHARYRWTILTDKITMYQALDLEMERQMRGGLSPETEIIKARRFRRERRVTRQSAEKVAIIEDRLGLPVGAVVGPEPPKPMAQMKLAGEGPNAPAALVMAAKQYRHGHGDETVAKAQALVKQLKEMGIEPPDDLVDKATVKRDIRLESVVLVLPYIESLERRLVQAEDQLRQQADYGQLRQVNEKQKHQIERLVAERTAQALSDRPRN